MAEIIVPTWRELQRVIGCSREELLICSPYFSSAGLGQVFDSLSGKPRVRFWTRLSPSDWANGVSDPPQLLALAELLSEAGFGFELGIHQRLHGKAYIADAAAALVGSSNLSEGGFDRNIEFMISFRGTETRAVLDQIRDSCQPNLKVVPVAALREWIRSSESAIEDVRRSNASEPETLAPVQSALDRVLGYGGGARGKIVEPGLGDMDDFVAWLRRQAKSPGAKTLIRRHDNADGQNLTGHFRQSFFGSLRFLRENPQFIAEISKALDQLRGDRLYEPSDSVASAWIDHLDRRATDSGAHFSYPTLRGILPPSLGGTRLGGGGGISTIKRMLPLVARYLEESASPKGSKKKTTRG